jgi:EAL domain-containing protein (putative c-di-GMP-specific phosphodiesterase class I)
MLDSVTPHGSPDCGQAGERSASRSWAHLAEEQVRSGLEGGVAWEGLRLATHFQPIYCVRRGKCHGFEALVRATDGDGAAVRPNEIFDATASNRRVLLDWTLRALHLRNFARLDPGHGHLFINVHPEAVVNDATRGRELGALIRYYGLVPKRVCVEILEAGCADEGLLREAVSAYRALGVTIAMDDFGVAHSNFDRVVRLRPDIVKIDRSLLSEAMIGETRARRVLSALVDLVHEANARVAIEGIESAAEAQVALEANADFLQGFHFGLPCAALPDDAPGQARLAEILGGRPGRRLSIA